MDHISTALADAAWDRYEQASATASRYLRGDQLDLVTVIEERQHLAFWLDTYLACERESIFRAVVNTLPEPEFFPLDANGEPRDR